MATLSYRPEIDGLRAFAVVPVILFHMGFAWISGGFIGVDVFFVISGFLISSILRKELGAGTFSFKRFWTRRIRRIVPAMSCVTLATLVFTSLVVFKPDQMDLGKQALAALLSVANIYFWLTTGDYWGPKAEESPFLHTWSLSVEEQFYVFFPLAVWLVYRYRPRWLPATMLVVVVTSFALFLFGAARYPDATFYLLPTRAWELAIGAYLAFAIAPERAAQLPARWSNRLALLGLLLVVGSYVLVSTLTGWLAVAVLGTALVIACGGSGICQTILAQPQVVHLGKLSYSLYLWHWPVLVFAEYSGFTGPTVLLFVPIYVLSLASYAWVEKPGRQRAGAMPAIGISFLLTVGFSLMLVSSSGMYDTTAFARPRTYVLYYDLKPQATFDAQLKRIVGNSETPRREAASDAYLHGGIIVGEGSERPEIVVLGDSHGLMWSDAIRQAVEHLQIKTSFYSMAGVTPFVTLPISREQVETGVLSEQKYQFDIARLEWIKTCRPRLVILCARWAQVTTARANDLLTFLSEHAEHVLLMEQPPEIERIRNRNVLQYLCYLHVQPAAGVKQYLPMLNPEIYHEGRTLIRQLAAQHPRCQYLPIYDLYARDREVMVLDGDEVVYIDDDHLSAFGARLAVPRIEQRIGEILSTPTGPGTAADESR